MFCFHCTKTLVVGAVGGLELLVVAVGQLEVDLIVVGPAPSGWKGDWAMEDTKTNSGSKPWYGAILATEVVAAVGTTTRSRCPPMMAW